MSFQSNLPRWVTASCAQFFKLRIGDQANLFLEGQERRTEALSQWLEFRLDGPYVVELSQNYFKVNIEINMLCVAQIDLTDFYKIHKLAGIALDCFVAIPIYKYGDGPDDDQSLIDCMIITRSTDQREAIRVSHFGRVNPDQKILQSSVEGHYHLYVTG